MGCIYTTMEIIIRWINGDLIGFMGQSRMSLTGWTSIWMLFVGGLCGIVCGLINERKLAKLPMFVQCIIGGVSILTIEFIAGVILNLWFHLSVWDYSDEFANLLGQICLKNGLLFTFVLCPFAFWVDDMIRFFLFNEGKKYSCWVPYKRLILDFFKPHITNKMS